MAVAEVDDDGPYSRETWQNPTYEISHKDWELFVNYNINSLSSTTSSDDAESDFGGNVSSFDFHIGLGKYFPHIPRIQIIPKPLGLRASHNVHVVLIWRELVNHNVPIHLYVHTIENHHISQQNSHKLKCTNTKLFSFQAVILSCRGQEVLKDCKLRAAKD